MAAIRDTTEMLRAMTPALTQNEFIFCSTTDIDLVEKAKTATLAWFREEEGLTLVLELEVASQLGFDVTTPMRRITLKVFSALDGVGLTAAVSTTLASHNIPCNIVAAYHHDHVFVPSPLADHAFYLLELLQNQADQCC